MCPDATSGAPSAKNEKKRGVAYRNRIDALMNTFMRVHADTPSSYHTAKVVAEELEGNDFVEFRETETWDEKFASTNRGYVIRDGAIIGWIRPDKVSEKSSFQIVGAHTDSPAFKLKPIPFSQGPGNASDFTMANLEVYGGPILASWFDRDLCLAGRVVNKEGKPRLLFTGPVARIPHLAIHLYRQDDLHIDRQKDLQAIVSTDLGPEKTFKEILGDSVAWDVFAVPMQPGHRIGLKDEFFAAGRLDNLTSVFAGMMAMITMSRDLAKHNAVPENFLIFAAFDHEEVGSNSRSGAAGPFLEDVLGRIAALMGIEGDALRAMYARSFCVSADAAHSIHPNYTEKYDPHTVPVLNEGPVLKLNANQRYATDSWTAARWLAICKAQNVPVQYFVSNNDVPCGTTIGPITATRLGIPTVDVGVPLLSMHSSRELCGVYDIDWLHSALTGFYAAKDRSTPNATKK